MSFLLNSRGGMERQMACKMQERALHELGLCRMLSVHGTRRVTHLCDDYVQRGGSKDTLTLLLFYLPVIWECSVLPVGNAFFQAAVQRRPGCGSGSQAASLHPPETQGAAGRRPKDGAAQLSTSSEDADTFKDHSLDAGKYKL